MSNSSDIQYICPSCFGQRTANDVLFLRNTIKRTPDYIKRRFWRSIHGQRGLPSNTRCLADWRNYPQSLRRIRNGLVTALRDYHGDLLEQRVCPECHFLLPRPDAERLTLLPWSGAGADFPLGEALFHALVGREDGWHTDDTRANPGDVLLDYRRLSLQETTLCLQFPVGLMPEGESVNQQLLDRYLLGCNAALLLLELDTPVQGEVCADVGAVAVLLRLMRALNSDCEPVKMPVAVLLCPHSEQLPENCTSEQWLERTHHNLSNALRTSLTDYRLFPWPDDVADSAAAVAEWLVSGAFQKHVAPLPPTEPAAPQSEPDEAAPLEHQLNPSQAPTEATTEKDDTDD